jgi:hypothetical protein
MEKLLCGSGYLLLSVMSASILKDDTFLTSFDRWNNTWIVYNYLKCCWWTPLTLSDSQSKTTTLTIIFLLYSKMYLHSSFSNFLSHLSQICQKFCPFTPQNHCPWQEKCKKDKDKRDSDTPLVLIYLSYSLLLSGLLFVEIWYMASTTMVPANLF